MLSFAVPFTLPGRACGKSIELGYHTQRYHQADNGSCFRRLHNFMLTFTYSSSGLNVSVTSGRHSTCAAMYPSNTSDTESHFPASSFIILFHFLIECKIAHWLNACSDVNILQIDKWEVSAGTSTVNHGECL